MAPPVGGEAGQVATLPAWHERFSRAARGSVVAAGQHEGGLRSPGGVEQAHQQPYPPLAHLHSSSQPRPVFALNIRIVVRKTLYRRRNVGEKEVLRQICLCKILISNKETNKCKNCKPYKCNKPTRLICYFILFLQQS